MSLVRGSLRIVYKRKLETLVLFLLVTGIIVANSSLLVMKENMKNQVYIQTKDTMGHVLAVGLFDMAVVDRISSLPGVVEVRLYPVWFGTVSLGNETVSIPLVGWSLASRTTVFVLEGDMSGKGQAVYYYVVTMPPNVLKLNYTIGDIVEVKVPTLQGGLKSLKFEISGVARGYAFLGGQPQSLVVPDNVITSLTGGRYTLLSVLGESDDPGHIDNLAKIVINALEENGYRISWYIVNKKEENPIVVLFESGISLLSSLTVVTVALAAIIPVTAGFASVVRDTRLIGVLKSIGVGRLELILYYGLPWVVRALLGFLVGWLMSPWVAKLLIEKVIIRDADIVKLQFEAVPFEPYYGLVLITGLKVLGVIIAASMLPGLYALRLNTIDALSFIGLKGGRSFGLKMPSISLTIHVREILSRPWKLAALVTAILVILTMSISSIIEAQSINNVAYIYENAIPADAYIYATSTLPSPPNPIWETISKTLNEYSNINWVIGDESTIINALGIGDRFGIITILEGDPSIAYPLERGRYPMGQGEAVISRSLALYLNLELGDTLKLRGLKGPIEVTIVGISKSREYNGFFAIVDRSTYLKAAGVMPGIKSAYTAIDIGHDLEDNVERYSSEIVKRLESFGFIDASSVTKAQIVESIKQFSTMILGLMMAISIIGGVMAMIVITGIAILDITGRIKEIAVYNALGIARSWVLVGIAVQMLLSTGIATMIGFYSGYILADVISKASARAIGYLEPKPPGLDVVFNVALWLPVLVAISMSLIVIWFRLRRLNLTLALAE